MFRFFMFWKPLGDVGCRLLSNHNILWFCILDKEKYKENPQDKLKVKAFKPYMVLETIVYLPVSQEFFPSWLLQDHKIIQIAKDI